jgi:GNAT superfamily N-acetyltransferase
MARVPITVQPARIDDLDDLPGIEREAAGLFVGWHVPLEVLQETTPLDEFAAAQRRGHLWVARSQSAGVFGFALVELVDGTPHLEELDVAPSHGRQGIGRALVQFVKAWARRSGYTSVTLTTFRDIPWNAPFYARLGFRVLAPAELSPALQSVVADEAARGLDPATRVVMCCSLGAARRGAMAATTAGRRRR